MAIDLYTWLILSALASFRVAELLVLDDGPFEMFIELRGWLNGRNAFFKNIGATLSCVHCTGLYAAFFFGICYFFQNIYLFAIVFLFAIAGLQSFIANRLGRRS